MIPVHERSGQDAPANPAGILFINGKERAVPQPASVRGALEALGLLSRPVAVELNGRLVRRADQETTALKAGDRVEIVSFVGGG
ncbi:MAG: sulfur carrier protein ThiS [Acidobacteria bacterium]|nr:sulfur carrier protein ThiS [Acidobacteriota bacterium]MXW38647.1 sulfur carrier protein ThiS [Acidobacteriota bacterium]MYA45997.1 sulfur carrier protein ThiS [Acidobacteriota bacterium]MYH21104.1 sulfur carrier protein ThiS [Acidobacteriota bacterium]MYI38628.1 sulfur carrier protein ThiS [Acidobacteriota bacterium]